MERSHKNSAVANKRSQRCAVVSYWNDQRVVPTKVNGKTTYVVISTRLPSGECGGKGNGMRHQEEVFPSEFVKHDILDSSLKRHGVCRNNAVHMVANHSEADTTDSNDHGKNCKEDRDKDSGLHLNGSDDTGGSSGINLAQSFEQQMITAETPSSIISNSSTSRTSCRRKQSAIKVGRRLSGERGTEASTDFPGVAMVISHVIFFFSHF